MAEAVSLSQRIKAEFDSRAQRLKTEEQERATESQGREKRLEQFARTCEDLKAVWRPRLDEFAKQFGDKIKVTPKVTPEQREAAVNFVTDLANISLRITVSPSSDVKKLVLDYDLLILPMFFEYERHSRLEVPLDKIDRDALGKWLDDRLVACVKAYLSIQDNEYYLKRAMVEDPITRVKLLRTEAKAQLEHGGNTYYFSSEDSYRQFKEQHSEAVSKPAGPAATKPVPVEPKPTAAPQTKPVAAGGSTSRR